MAVPNSSGTAPPRHEAPEGAVDSHHHVFDQAFPRPSGELTTIGTKTDYALFRRRLGLSRSVIVAPSTYGRSNDCLLDALAFFGDTARAVAIVDPEATGAELDALHRRGVRGMRLYLGKGSPATPDTIRRAANVAAGLGWHIEIVVSHATALLCEAEATLAALPCPVVIDHFGFVRQPGAKADPAYAALRRLLEAGSWVKLSGVYHVSASPTEFSDVDDLARGLVALRPDRLLWGSDWPHTGAGTAKPNAAELFDQLWRWATPLTVRRILVDNPATLYWSI